jgi:hypothetical protein
VRHWPARFALVPARSQSALAAKASIIRDRAIGEGVLKLLDGGADSDKNLVASFVHDALALAEV